jgi:hypothetical protein
VWVVQKPIQRTFKLSKESRAIKKTTLGSFPPIATFAVAFPDILPEEFPLFRMIGKMPNFSLQGQEFIAA